MSTSAAGLADYRDRVLPAGDPRRGERYWAGDVTMSLLQTELGKVVHLVHGVSNPYPYSKLNHLAGTRGAFEDFPPRIYLEPKQTDHEWGDFDQYASYDHWLWTEIGPGPGGHGGMDFLMLYRLTQTLRLGLVPTSTSTIPRRGAPRSRCPPNPSDGVAPRWTSPTSHADDGRIRVPGSIRRNRVRRHFSGSTLFNSDQRGGSMDRHERLSALLDMVGQRDKIDVEKTAEELDVSPATIPAARMIERGMIVGLNGGTTTTEIGRAIAMRADFNDCGSVSPTLTVVTNALNIAHELAVRPNIKIVTIGGVARQHSFELTGPLAELLLNEITLDLVFLGVDAFDVTRGAYAHHEGEASINKLLAQRARQVVVVTDSSKLGGQAFAQICPGSEVDMLITDESADPDVIREFEEQGLEVITACAGRAPAARRHNGWHPGRARRAAAPAPAGTSAAAARARRRAGTPLS